MAGKASGAARGFTMLEMLIVIGIIGMLVALLLPVLAYAKRRTRETVTATVITDLKNALIQYHAHEGSMPLKPGSSTMLIDNKSGAFHPLYYQSECAPKGSAATGKESNKELLDLLQKQGKKFNLSQMKDGSLIDGFGRPLLVRFLILKNGTDDNPSMEEAVLIWSYGHDGINAVDAKPSYTNQGAAEYDNPESAAMQAQPAAGSDDLTSWRTGP